MPKDMHTRDIRESSQRLGFESYRLYQGTSSSNRRDRGERALIRQALRQAQRSQVPEKQTINASTT